MIRFFLAMLAVILLSAGHQVTHGRDGGISLIATDVSAELGGLINAERKRKGRKPLTRSDALDAAAA